MSFGGLGHSQSENGPKPYLPIWFPFSLFDAVGRPGGLSSLRPNAFDGDVSHETNTLAPNNAEF